MAQRTCKREFCEEIRDLFRITQPFCSGLGRVFGHLVGTENSILIVIVIGSATEKFRSSLFKGLRFPKAEPWSLVATSEIPLSVFSFLLAFSFAPFESKEKADKQVIYRYRMRADQQN